MIPTGAILNAQVEEKQMPSLTWKLDFKKEKITGKLGEVEAIKQSVYMSLQTNRFEHIIYSSNYGVELKSLIGKNPLLVESEVRRLVNEALTQDDRIQGIENLSIESHGDSMTVAFTVVSALGNFEFTQEVSS